MEKNVATEIIGKVFNKGFNIDGYTVFMRNLLNDFDESRARDWAQGNYIYEAYREHISRFKRIGLYTDPDGLEVELLVIETKTTAKLERARTMLRNFVIKRLQDKNRDYALAAFYSKEDDGADWRFSFIKIEHESYKSDKGKIKTRKELTPAKRYSFLVGEYEHAYTAQKQLLPVIQNDYSHPTVEELEQAFSIEKVTSEFFEQYKDLYLKLSEHFDSKNAIKKVLKDAEIDVNRFTKKLLGQIVFLYFLQKKGWLGVPKNEAWGKGDRRFLQTLYSEADENKKNFFNDYLKYLFYDALAKQRPNSAEPAYYKRFDCKIPFLNGGLFEADYDWKEVDLVIPNTLFRNDEKTKAGDKGTGILDVFDRYNFTIKEDEPLEKEVAVDPEMLGKVFENMLEITERKSKGAFYTPREIVHYMCQESLIQYLNNAVNDAPGSYQPIDDNQLAMFEGTTGKKGQTKLEIEHKGKTLVPLTELEDFIHKGHLAIENDWNVTTKGRETDSYKYQLPEHVKEHADLLDKKLTDIKICDPAIGSGAFPVGILHELVVAQKALLPYLSEKYLHEKLEKIDLKKSDYKKDREKYTYRIKRHAIQESIYGVDIDASAIDIARLRLWLSMIVDEDDLDKIEALPNLDYKIVKGNALIGMHENAMRDMKAETELENLKKDFFDETDEKDKRQLREKINDKIRQLLHSAEQFAGYKIAFDFKLFFSEVWHQKNGFDIVIGNPPYLRIQGIREHNPELANFLVNNFSSATGAFDLYVCFSEKGIQITNQRGILNFIMPIKWTNASFGKGFRLFLKKNRAAKKIISFGAYQVFNASTYTGIQLFQRNTPILRYHELGTDLVTNSALEQYISNLTLENYTSISAQSLTGESWMLTNNETGTLISKLKKQKNCVKDIFEKFFTGLQTSKDSVYFLTNCRIEGDLINGYSDELEKEVKIETGLVKPLLKGDQVHRYENLITDTYVIFPYAILEGKAILIDEKTLKKLYPLGHKYLKANQDTLMNRESGKLLDDEYWYRYIYPKNLTLFGTAKLITPYISKHSQLSYDGTGSLTMNTKCFGLIVKTEFKKWRYETLLSILNSDVCWYYISKTGTVFRGGYYAYTPDYLNSFPIPNLDKVDNLLHCLVQYLFVSKKENSLLYDFFEQVINGIVYELYFTEEIKLANKEIIRHLANLRSVDENIKKEKKLAIIQTEFNRLYDPNHPVRNNLETLDSIEEIRIIKLSLK